VTLALGNNPGGDTLNRTLTQTVSVGMATFADLLLISAGSGYTLIASAAGLADLTSQGFAITPAAADHLVFLQEPVDTGVGQTMPAVVVAVGDAVDRGHDDVLAANLGMD
jgi:hypothetical protein